MTASDPGKGPNRRVRFLVFVGLVAVLASIGVDGWIMGYFKPRPKVALITWNDDPYWDPVINGAQDAAASHGLDLVVIRSQPDEKTQTQHVRDLLDQGIKGLAISPRNPAGQLDVLNEAADKTVLVTMDSDAPVVKRKAFVGSDNYAAGQLAGEEVRHAIPDGGDVIISVGSITMANGRERRQGLIDNLLDRRPSPDNPVDPVDAVLKGAHYAVVATVLDDGDSGKAVTSVADAIKAHPDTRCIVGMFSYSAPAMVKAVAQAGKAGQIKVIGFDELNATQAGVVDKSIYSSILQDQYRCGFAAIDTIYDHLEGVDRFAPTGVQFVPLRLRVMNTENLSLLREDHMIRSPG